ncbi:MAG TPA: ABC transporter permease subunit [Solirubrobacteraceae bacterium]|nr:ABC transporter permease subunit [Solirubrobacteraceae bacterium]
MRWLAARQFRVQAAVGFGALLAVAVLMLVTGLHLRDLYDADCKAHVCSGGAERFVTKYHVLRALLGLGVLATPLLIGLFWGAPLIARELESGTFRLAWTQSVARTSWLAAKLTLVGLASVLVAGLYSLMFTWCVSPIESVAQERFNLGAFDEHGIVAIGYAAFAFALGVLAGAITRRTLVAMGITVLVFVGVRLGMSLGVREHLMSPVKKGYALTATPELGFLASPSGVIPVAGAPRLANAWTLSSEIVDKAGDAVPEATLHEFVSAHCPRVASPPSPAGGAGARTASPPARNEFDSCVSLLSTQYHEVVYYQPANRYWTFQALEMAIFLVLGALLAGGGFWWVRRRLT